MGMINCTKHGWQGVELVAPAIKSSVDSGTALPASTKLVTIHYDELEFDRFTEDEHLNQFASCLEPSDSNTFRIKSEEHFDHIYGSFLPVCGLCLRERLEELARKQR
jgi:hypothetical protein